MREKVKAKDEKGITVMTLVIAVVIIIVVGLLFTIIINKNKSKETVTDGNAGVSVGQEDKKEEFVQKQSDGSKLNTSKELQKTKKLDGLEFTNIQLKEIGGITTLLADIENKTGKTSQERTVTVEILDKQGKVITSLRGTVAEIPAGGKDQLNVGVTSDVANAYDFRIK